jgi:predicted flap endonuclease-1-like 5' DNA nuclease
MAQVSSSEESWPAGWVYAVVAGIIAAILARWIGDVAMPAAVLVGLFVLLVFGVLLGMFWGRPAVADEAYHGHGDHGHEHDGHGHEVHTPEVGQHEVAAAEPVVTPAPVASPETGVAPPAEMKPVALSGPRGGVADKLQTIEGIGPAMEKLCHELGIYHFDQIAAWGAAEVAWMDSNLKGFKGRVTRDRWVRQASLIGEVGIDEFLRRAKMNDY